MSCIESSLSIADVHATEATTNRLMWTHAQAT